MSDITAAISPIETRADLGNDPGADVRFWLQQLKLAEREQKTWIERGRKIVKRYRDERTNRGKENAKFNILWSNVETLKPILYGRTPKPDVERRHKNDDPIARLGAEILERALGYEDDLDEFDAVMIQVVEDRLLPGRGVARVYYEPQFGAPETDPEADDREGRPQYRPVIGERAPVRYVFWEDYRESPARNAAEVWWVAYRAYLTRDELVERFGKKLGAAVPLDYAPKGMEDTGGEDGRPQADAFKKAQVWEIWDRRRRQTVWLAPGYTASVLDSQDDPLGIPSFFPSPKPLCATTTNETSIPVADYSEYQDQAIELDILTARIDRLQGALKVAGLYAASNKAEIQQLIDGDTENRLIPVEDWAAFADKGGLRDMIAWLPIEQIAAVLIQLYDARDRVQRTLYQITGMADILRGETNPNETLGAQQLKSQFATRRISMAQKEVARFARDLMRLRGFVMARHFSPETLTLMTGFPEPLPALPPAPPPLVPMPMQPPAPPQAPQMPHPGMPPGAVPRPSMPVPGVPPMMGHP